MSDRNAQSAFSNIDLVTFSLFLALLGIGWLMVYTVNYEEASSAGILGFFSTNIGKQTIWMIISLVVLFFVLLIDRKFWETFAFLFYLLSIVLLVAVLLFGTEIKGSTSWFVFGGFSFQPSELAKFTTCLGISSYLSSYNANIKDLKSLLIAIGIFVLPMTLIILQGDLGSASVFLSFFILLFREGLSTNFYIFGIVSAILLLLGIVFEPFDVITGMLFVGAAILAISQPKNKVYWIGGIILVISLAGIFVEEIGVLPLFIGALVLTIFLSYWSVYKHKRSQLVRALILSTLLGAGIVFVANFSFNNFLRPHQQERITDWLKPSEADRQNSFYHVVQSKLAISSGGLTGKGFLKGTLTSLDYVPEQTTDFIFCTIGEEQGFVGSLGIIGLFLVLLIRFTVLAERQRANFSRHYIYAVAGLIFFHVIINIGMTMGLVPVIGIPLPLISKGGSSFLGFTIMIAVLMRLDGNRFKV